MDDLQKQLSDKILELKRRNHETLELESFPGEVQTKDANITKIFGKCKTVKHFDASVGSLPKVISQMEVMLESALSLAGYKQDNRKEKELLTSMSSE